MAGNDHDLVNFGEEHELNYILKKYNHAQTKENRQKLVALGEKVKKELGKTRLSRKEIYASMEEAFGSQ